MVSATGLKGIHNEHTGRLWHMSPHATHSCQCHRVPLQLHVHIHFKFQLHQSPSLQCPYRCCQCLAMICICLESSQLRGNSHRCCTSCIVCSMFSGDWLVKSVKVEYVGWWGKYHGGARGESGTRSIIQIGCYVWGDGEGGGGWGLEVAAGCR